MLRAVIPAKAGIHLCFKHQSNMDSRFRGNDGLAKRTVISPATGYFSIIAFNRPNA